MFKTNVIFIVVIFLISANYTSMAQTKLSLHNYYFYHEDLGTDPSFITATLATQSALNKTFSFASYSLIREHWGESVFGVDVNIAPWLIAGFKVGLQTGNGSPERYSPVVYLFHKKLFFFGVYEWGGDKDRSQCIFTYKLGAFRIGATEVHNGSFIAAGPLIEFYIPNTIFMIYSSAMDDLNLGKFCAQFGWKMRLNNEN